MNTTIVTISGNTCSGKSTLENMLVERYPDIFDKIVSHTTRPQRTKEVHGVDYYFVNDQTFAQSEMMECVEFGGFSYGASRKEFERVFDEGKIPVIVVTPDGTKQIEDKCDSLKWNVVSLWIGIQEDVLNDRFKSRLMKDLDNADDIVKVCETYVGRLNQISSEEKTWENYWDWTIKFEKFDASTEDAVIETVLGLTVHNTSTPLVKPKQNTVTDIVSHVEAFYNLGTHERGYASVTLRGRINSGSDIATVELSRLVDDKKYQQYQRGVRIGNATVNNEILHGSEIDILKMFVDSSTLTNYLKRRIAKSLSYSDFSEIEKQLRL